MIGQSGSICRTYGSVKMNRNRFRSVGTIEAMPGYRSS
ncbi:Uncharacterised protein [Mycobacteroides abscessus subsp. abscessus]|nr:Uncharacterised protein [Mycobacteroides abscessus subsp. abscessus]